MGFKLKRQENDSKKALKIEESIKCHRLFDDVGKETTIRINGLKKRIIVRMPGATS
jgi:hypothetical protein